MRGKRAQQAAFVAVFLPSGQATRLVKAAMKGHCISWMLLLKDDWLERLYHWKRRRGQEEQRES